MRHAVATTLFCCVTAVAQAPANFYSSVVTTSGPLLRASLHDVIDDHTRYPYTSGGTDTWDILKIADEDPSNSGRVLDIYRNASYPKATGGNPNYNREHIWPNSYGFPADSGSNYPYTDCHNLFLCDIGYNSQRDRKPFDAGSSSWVELTTVNNQGQGGGSGVYPGNSNWRTSSNSPGAFEVWPDRRGDVARALFYMDVRYEGGTHQSGAAEPDLILTDNVSLITSSATGGNVSVAYMGRLSTLLQWHADDPVDARELARNDAVSSYQGNRNPFVDHPEWVDCIFQGQCASTTGRPPEVWINELHYRNVGADTGEFVEVAGRAGTRLDNWMLIAYDGATGAAYGRIALRGAIPAQLNDHGVLSFDFPGLRNGTDGVALVTGEGVVLQFLSYGGAFVGTNGACKGIASQDIGVIESASTPPGFSLRLSGVGDGYGQFSWQPPFFQSAGTINVGQVMQ